MQMVNGSFTVRKEISPNLEKAIQQIHNGTVEIVNNVPSASSIVTSSDVTPLSSQSENSSNEVHVDDNFNGIKNTGWRSPKNESIPSTTQVNSSTKIYHTSQQIVNINDQNKVPTDSYTKEQEKHFEEQSKKIQDQLNNFDDTNDRYMHDITHGGVKPLGKVVVLNVSGHINDKNGSPISNVNITTDHGDSTTSDLMGYYHLDIHASSNASDVGATITYSKKGYGTYIKKIPDLSMAGYVVTYNVTLIKLRGDFKKAPVITVKGHIIGKYGGNIPDVNVSCDSGDSTKTDINGNFNLPIHFIKNFDMAVRVTYSKDGYEPITKKYSTSELGKVYTEDNLVLNNKTPVITVKGHVKDKSGKNLSGVKVSSYSGDSTKTDINGNFTLPIYFEDHDQNSLFGNYQRVIHVIFSKDGYQTFKIQYPTWTRGKVYTENNIILYKKSEFHPFSPGTQEVLIQGHVKSKDGLPISGANVVANSDNKVWVPGANVVANSDNKVQTDDNGFYKVKVTIPIPPPAPEYLNRSNNHGIPSNIYGENSIYSEHVNVTYSAAGYKSIIKHHFAYRLPKVITDDITMEPIETPTPTPTPAPTPTPTPIPNIMSYAGNSTNPQSKSDNTKYWMIGGAVALGLVAYLIFKKGK